MKSLISVIVPNDSYDFIINKVGCLRYSHNRGLESSCVEPNEMKVYLEEDKHKIIGITKVNELKVILIEEL